MLPANAVLPAEIVVIETSCPSYLFRPERIGSFDSVAEISAMDGIDNTTYNALISGDSHGNELTMMQQWGVKGIISLKKRDDWGKLSLLAQSTVLDQIRALDQQILAIELEIRKIQKEKKELNTCLMEIRQDGITEEADEVVDILAEQDERQSYLNRLLQQKKDLLEILCTEARKEKHQYQEIVDWMSVLDIKTLVGDIGDGIGDRHSNEWKRLYLNKVFRIKGGKNFILESNHGLESHLSFLTHRWDVDDQLFLLGDDVHWIPPEARSLTNLRTALAHGIVSRAEINELMEHWIECLHLVTCSHVHDRVTIYSHAPIGLNVIQDVALKYGVSYQDETPEDLCHTIQAVDACFRASLIKDTTSLSRLYQEVRVLLEKYLEAYLFPENKEALANRYNDDYIRVLYQYLSSEHQNALEAGENLSQRAFSEIIGGNMKNLVLMIHLIEAELFLEETRESEKMPGMEEDKEKIAQIKKTFLYQSLEEIEQTWMDKHFDPKCFLREGKLLHFFWNRERNCLQREKEHNGYQCYFAYGHHKDWPSEIVPVVPSEPDNVRELDNLYGRATRPEQVYYSLDSLRAENLTMMGQNAVHCFVGYRFYSEVQAGVFEDAQPKTLPRHYFSGVISVEKSLLVEVNASETLSCLVKMPEFREILASEMDENTRSVILHSTRAIPLSFLEVKGESFPKELDHSKNIQCDVEHLNNMEKLSVKLVSKEKSPRKRRETILPEVVQKNGSLKDSSTISMFGSNRLRSRSDSEFKNHFSNGKN